MSLTVPEEIRSLQRNLYAKAKKEPDFRFYSLYDKVHRTDILAHAYRTAKANKGAAGVDGMTFEAIEILGLGDWLIRLQEDLRTRRYKREAVRRVLIPKPGGGERPLGIPTIRDRVAQTAASLVLTPIFEADFGDDMYGYRPRRNAQDAVKAVHQALKEGYTDVVDGDLSKYFDTIPHAELLRSVARRVSDGAMLHLVKLWLKTPIEETDKAGRKRRTGGRGNTKGTPQGGVISPLLANIYMNRFLRAWREKGMGRRLEAKVVNYADDFVILCKGTAGEALAVTERWMKVLKLTLNEKKTCLRDARAEHFDFLGYTFGPIIHKPTGQSYLGVLPSRKAVGRLRDRMRGIMKHTNQAPWEAVVVSANRVLLGWANYFSCGNVNRAHWWVDAFMLRRARVFLTRRHKVPGQGTRRFPPSMVFGPQGLISLTEHWRRAVKTSHAWA
ncbi:MAG: group II intron reverse transcriptase/maturase [bacterium]